VQSQLLDLADRQFLLRGLLDQLNRGAHVELAGDVVGDEAGAVFGHALGLLAGVVDGAVDGGGGFVEVGGDGALFDLDGNFPIVPGLHPINNGLNIPNSQLDTRPRSRKQNENPQTAYGKILLVPHVLICSDQ